MNLNSVLIACNLIGVGIAIGIFVQQSRNTSRQLKSMIAKYTTMKAYIERQLTKMKDDMLQILKSYDTRLKQLEKIIYGGMINAVNEDILKFKGEGNGNNQGNFDGSNQKSGGAVSRGADSRSCNRKAG